MKIFFLCRTGHHTSLIAAGLHLGLIKRSKGVRRIVSGIRGWNNLNLPDLGTPFYVGKDKENNEIYTIGISSESTMMERAVNEMLNLIGVVPQERRIINVSQAVSGWTKLGLAIKKVHLDKVAKICFYMGIDSELKKVSEALRNNSIMPCC